MTLDLGMMAYPKRRGGQKISGLIFAEACVSDADREGCIVAWIVGRGVGVGLFWRQDSRFEARCEVAGFSRLGMMTGTSAVSSMAVFFAPRERRRGWDPGQRIHAGWRSVQRQDSVELL